MVFPRAEGGGFGGEGWEFGGAAQLNLKTKQT